MALAISILRRSANGSVAGRRSSTALSPTRSAISRARASTAALGSTPSNRSAKARRRCSRAPSAGAADANAETPCRRQPRYSVRRPARDLDAINPNRPPIGTLDSEDRFHHCRLARSVRADQAENFSGRDREADVLDRRQPAETLEEALDLQPGRRCAHVASRAPLTMPSNPPGKKSTTVSATPRR